jgi:hypothetical protein
MPSIVAALIIIASPGFIFARKKPNGFDPRTQLLSFENVIRDAELLLSYAATAGIALNQTDSIGQRSSLAPE